MEATNVDPSVRMSAVDRAVAELRRGLGVVIETDGTSVLAEAAETVTAETLAAFRSRANGGACLALTAQRAAALGLTASANGIVTLPLASEMDPLAIRRLTDPTVLGSDSLSEAIRTSGEDAPGGAAAAIDLTKLAELLPAALVASVPDPADRPIVDAAAIADYPRLAASTLRPVSQARVPLAGAEDARVIGFRPANGGMEQLAIVVGDPAQNQPVLCRLHGACFTGDLLGSLRCDCGPQLQRALAVMAEAGHGVLLYLAHEGRGIGLMNKLRAYELQDRGLDTVDANLHLGFAPDERTFAAAAVMLGHLGIDRVRLLTNNPAKMAALQSEGIEVVERVVHAMPPNPHNRSYLATKAARAGHLLEMEVEP